MTKDNTMKNKSQLAKLLATENIEVQENQVQTASFDVVNRILTIPIFKEEQKSKNYQGKISAAMAFKSLPYSL